MNEIKNWKLKELSDSVDVIENDSIEFIEKTLEKLQIPKKYNQYLNRAETYIDWDSIPKHYTFFFDYEGWEERVKIWLENSLIGKQPKLIITYGNSEPVVKIPTSFFLEDWEGFFASTKWQTLIFSEDFKLIMEVSRDYYLHSNFIIKNDGCGNFGA